MSSATKVSKNIQQRGKIFHSIFCAKDMQNIFSFQNTKTDTDQSATELHDSNTLNLPCIFLFMEIDKDFPMFCHICANFRVQRSVV
jgi:hypothetical protein